SIFYFFSCRALVFFFFNDPPTTEIYTLSLHTLFRSRAHHDADRGELVLGLDDGELVLAGFLVDAQLRAGALESLSERGGGRDRVPGADGGAAVQAAERRRRVALDEDLVADGVGALGPQAHRVLQILFCKIQPQLERVEVRLQEFLLALVLLADQLGDHFRLYPHHAGERADVEDVLEELPLPR